MIRTFGLARSAPNYMAMKRLFTLILFLNLALWGFGQQNVDSLLRLRPLSMTYFELPDADSAEVVFHTAYSLLYNEGHEQADWVAYMLTRSMVSQKIAGRSNNFIMDPLIKSQSAGNRDYAGSGYDRGHLAPAADMAWSATAMKESFYYSNMSPQAPSFNRGIWSKLEDQVRRWAMEYDTLYVVTGPILQADLPTIGPNKVSVPEHFYKVILHYTQSGVKGIGFILPNAGSNLPLQRFAVSIDSVQRVTGIRFFPKMPEQQEPIIKKMLSTEYWSW